MIDFQEKNPLELLHNATFFPSIFRYLGDLLNTPKRPFRHTSQLDYKVWKSIKVSLTYNRKCFQKWICWLMAFEENVFVKHLTKCHSGFLRQKMPILKWVVCNAFFILTCVMCIKYLLWTECFCFQIVMLKH